MGRARSGASQTQRYAIWSGWGWSGTARRSCNRASFPGSMPPFPSCFSPAKLIRVCARVETSRAHRARYPGTCRGRFASFEEAERISGRPAGARLFVHEGAISIADGVSGPQSWDVAREVGDFLIAKRDKAPAYQLAVVVDDAAQGVTEVLRGDDLLPSAARQWHVQRALGLPHPAWFHVPLVTDQEGRRLAKREAALSLDALRAGGTDPRALVAWAAKSAGLSLAERVTAQEVTTHFDLARLPREAVRLTSQALESLKQAR